MTSSGTAPAYRRLSVGQRRAQLIREALTLFAHRLPEEVSLDDVAAAAGVSRPLVYRYFPGGKQQLYEAALRSAADELEQCFAVPESGPLSDRLGHALDRYLAFVDSHDAGFKALLQGGSVVQTSGAHAIVDEVRQAAADEILTHLGFPPAGGRRPGPRLHMAVRTWITQVEAASLIWLDEAKRPSAAELREWLVEMFVAGLAVTAGRDAESAAILGAALALEEPGGPVGALLGRLGPVLGSAAHLVQGQIGGGRAQ